ncbi:hypothetical protein OESDEN_24926, partial [Oesophagostomum dentatum]
AYDAGDFQAHCEDGNAKDTFDSDGEDEDEEETEEESEEDTIREEEENKEELRKEEMMSKNEAKLLSQSERFTSWLGEATNQLEQLVVEEAGSPGDECPLLVHLREVERKAEPREEREPYIRAREELDRIEAEAAETPQTSEEPHPEHPVQHRPRKGHGAPSVTSTTSTIPPEEIKRRVALEKFRNKEK